MVKTKTFSRVQQFSHNKISCLLTKEFKTILIGQTNQLKFSHSHKIGHTTKKTSDNTKTKMKMQCHF